MSVNRIPVEVKSSRKSILIKIYQYYRLSCAFLFLALFARWLVLFPLVSSKWLPGGIHGFLTYLLGLSAVGEILWVLRYHGIVGGLKTGTFWKSCNFLYFVMAMHFYDDYEHAPILKDLSYSIFIVSLALNQAYFHYRKLFKSTGSRRSLWRKIDMFALLPALYASEFYLLLLNVQNHNFHTSPGLDKLNKAVLIAYIPVALHCYKVQLQAFQRE
ncbi:HHL093Cp [Eremothecium sinecaudum]|uniref:HHL093Cp n=1 Tax=Eremothecium sinecaudum TaxID=45286 RepID=A0A0X8HWC3_9SACH|nr:HHL093Cp [Eremothecium sinecaudum]AMD22677.1 HHL093Cp [Eremothecium sinecaudum]